MNTLQKTADMLIILAGFFAFVSFCFLFYITLEQLTYRYHQSMDTHFWMYLFFLLSCLLFVVGRVIEIDNNQEKK